jgi:hypothetical protein
MKISRITVDFETKKTVEDIITTISPYIDEKTKQRIREFIKTITDAFKYYEQEKKEYLKEYLKIKSEDDGMVLCNGYTYGRNIALPLGESYDDWKEMTEAEAIALIQENMEAMENEL